MANTGTGTLTSENYFASCTPAIRTGIDADGLLTITNLQVPTPDELDGIFTGSSTLATGRILEGLFDWRTEVNALTYKLYDLSDLLMDMAVDVSGRLATPESQAGMLDIAPFIYARREEPINNQSWSITGGLRSNSAGAAAADGAYWTVKITSPTGIPYDDKWFQNETNNTRGTRVFCTTLSDGGIVGETQWTVYDVLATLGGHAGHYLVLKPAMAGSTTGSGALTYGAFDFGDTNHYLEPPVTGWLVRGVPNVNPYQPNCAQPPGLLSNQMDPFWFECTQDSFVATESYRKWQEMLVANNKLYEQLYSLPEVQARKQAAIDFKNRLANQMMFGKASSINQTLAGYRSLDTVTFYYPPNIGPTSASGAYVGTAGSTEVVSRKADCIGIYEQHFNRGRVINLAGKAFNIPAMCEALYPLTRYRKEIGMPNYQVVEIMMARQYYPAWNAAMLQYYKSMSQDMLVIQQPLQGSLNKAPLGFVYRDYPLVYPPDITLRVVFHTYWDDLLARAKACGVENAGRQLWVIPWKYNRMGIVNTLRTVREVGDIETLAKVNPFYECQILGRKRWIELMNMCYTVICSAPQAGLIFTGVGGATPEPINQGNESYLQACGFGGGNWA
jgi:hypothetical protein